VYWFNSSIIKANNYLSPQTIEIQKVPQSIPMEINVVAWVRHKIVVELNRLIEWASGCCLTIQQFPAISWREQVNFQWDDDEVRSVLDQHAEFDFYSASSLK
jgi:hypothetical protein